MDYKLEFIEFMVRADVLTFGDFVTKSGRKTPYFVNTGKYSRGKQIAKLGGFYADCIVKHIKLSENTVLFGPAYKGAALAVATAFALAARDINIAYCYNRKEVKDHGEGGILIGHKLTENDRVLIIEDVITAGMAVREVMPLILNAGAVAEGLIISVDRMERGRGERTAIQEIWDEYAIPTFPIVTVHDIIKHLHNRPVDGNVPINDEIAARMEAYMEEYCTRDSNPFSN